MDVLAWADAENVQREGVAVTHARLKANFENSRSIDTLCLDILEDMAHIFPEHKDVYTEILDDIDYKFKNLYKA